MEILIIGGIAGGASIAAKAKRTNPEANVTIIEKEDYLSFGACGLPYYLGSEFDDPNMMYARSVEKTRENGINVLTSHEALEVDFDKKEVKVKDLESGEEKSLAYDRLAIATGARPNLFGEGSDSENVYTMTRERDANALKEELKDAKDIVVLGGGFIGIEVAEQLVELGKNVKVINNEDLILTAVFDKEISEILLEAGKEHGIEFHMDTSFESFKTKDGRAYEVVTSKGNFSMDAAVFALGFRPNTGFLDDERLEKLGNGAIKVDKTGKTSIEDVYAVGDAASVYHKYLGEEFYAALATYANKMGRLVGENIVSKEQKEYIGALGSSSIRVGEVGAASIGLTENVAKKNGFDVKTSFIKSKNQTAYVKGQEDIYIKLVYDQKTRVILGGQIAGKKGAVERASALTVAIHKEVTVDELGFMDFAYSPPFSPTWDPLNVAGNASK